MTESKEVGKINDHIRVPNEDTDEIGLNAEFENKEENISEEERIELPAEEEVKQKISEHINNLNLCLAVISDTKPIIYDKCIKTGFLSLQLMSLLGIEITDELIIASYIANAGYLSIPENILYKQSFLNDKEYKVIKMHPEVSVNLARTIYLNITDETLLKDSDDKIKKMLSIVHDHHELPMGKGYYGKINGVSRESFIIGVADRFIGATHQLGSIYKIVLDNDSAAKKAIAFFDETSPVFSLDDQDHIYKLLINYEA